MIEVPARSRTCHSHSAALRLVMMTSSMAVRICRLRNRTLRSIKRHALRQSRSEGRAGLVLPTREWAAHYGPRQPRRLRRRRVAKGRVTKADVDRPIRLIQINAALAKLANGNNSTPALEVAMTAAAVQAFILSAEVFALSFVAIAAIWLADRWRRGSGQQWTTTPKGPDTNHR